MKVFAWNVDTAETARRVSRFGVDGIITNAPDVVQAVIDGH
jgi:glycerophosphoryl diester phosphodiesterase